VTEGFTRRRFLETTGSAALAASLVGVGCSEDSDSANQSVLTIAVASDAGSADPHNFPEPRANEQAANIFDTLMWRPLDPKTGFPVAETAPTALVKSLDGNADKTEFIFTLASGRRFASGNPVTVDDVIWSLRRIGAASTGQHNFGLANIDPENPATKIDDRSFRVTASAPSNLILLMMTNIDFSMFDRAEYVKHASKSDPWANDWAKNHAAGGGPYVLGAVTPGVSSKLRRNPHYVGRFKPRFKRISLPVVPSVSNRVSLLERGNADLADVLPKQRIKALEDNPDLRVVDRESTRWVRLFMNNTVGPFKSKALRQAVNYAIPYDTIIDRVYYGYAKRDPGPIPGGDLYQNPELELYDTDLARAKVLAQQSGVTPTSVELVYDSVSKPEMEPLAIIVQAALKEIGIQVQLKPMQPTPFSQGLLSKKWESLLFEGSWFVPDPANTLAWFKTGDPFNLVNYSNPRVDRLVKELAVEVEPEKRRALAHEVQEIVRDDAPQGWLARPNSTAVMRKNIRGYYPHPTNLLHYRFMSRA
jgi:peptide/nickel transport system substrate-binding protein